MALIAITQLLLGICVAALDASGSITVADQPIQSALAPPNANSVVSSFNSIFSSLTNHRPKRFGPDDGVFCNPCAQCVGSSCDNTPLDFAALNIQLAGAVPQLGLARDSQDTDVPPSVAAATSAHERLIATVPYTAQTAPTRTTIHQAFVTHSTLPKNLNANNALTSNELQHEFDSGGKQPVDITKDYYASTLDGHASGIVPITVQDNQGIPVALLAHAKTVFNFNLISADLVEQLNLTHRVHSLSSLSSFDPHSDLEVMRSRVADIVGVLSLNVITGRNDATVANAEFLVFKPVTGLMVKPESRGKLQPDVYIGVDFLSRAGALTLRDDFVGIAPKEGLGIVVQKIYNSVGTPKEEVRNQIHHGEL